MAKRFTNAILFLFVVIFAFLCFPASVNAEAGEKAYSGVMEDLEKDSNFDASLYPQVDNDYSLQIFQLAESSDKELFLYVYQPSGKTKNFIATSIKLSTKKYAEIDPSLYSLTFCNSEGTLYKYVVNDLTVSDEAVRYYSIVSIFRKWDESVDKPATGGNTINEVDYAVGRQWTFGTVNGKPFCGVVDFETIVVTDKFVGYVRYKNGWSVHVGACDSHFVAFNTNKPIEKLLEAKVSYVTQDYNWSANITGIKETFGDPNPPEEVVLSGEKVEHTGGGWFAATYTWNRIETVEQFLSETDNAKAPVYSGVLVNVNAGVELTDTAKEELQKQKWVLRFLETNYSLMGGSSFTNESSTLVTEVTILQLKFETDGITYNLGVVDNKQTGDKDPAGTTTDPKVEPSDSLKELWKYIQLIFKVLCGVLLVVILYPVWNFLGGVLKAIFGFFKGLFGKIKKRKGGKK